jgi:hypothetical protein
LTDAVKALAAQAGINIQFDPKLLNTIGPDGHSIPVTPPIINEKWSNITARQALEALLDNWDWELKQIPGDPILRVAARDPDAVRPPETRFNLLENTPTNGAVIDDVSPEISLDHASLLDGIHVLATQAKLNVQLDPKLLYYTGPDGHSIPVTPLIVIEKWKNITARQALQSLLDNHGLKLVQTPGVPILRVVAKKP